jgi:predicted pyridoxine 5'-phosphate oxidase superfamily flavin-nucleotide-binding protein
VPYLLAATTESDGTPRARLLEGPTGFVRTKDEVTLEIDTGLKLEPGQPIGLLGIDFSTRRRNRANGKVRTWVDGKLTVDVLESFGNCPQHSTLRDVHRVAAQANFEQHFEGISEDARAIIARSDTFFIATSGGQYGVDISHRGGPLGFARVEGETLVVPDFKGNRYFNTFGNLLIDDRAALLFIDFASGDIVELLGTCIVKWASDADGGRRWHFSCREGNLKRASTALRWTLRL